jgi:NAD(P)H-dependent FMN reductase
VTPYNVTYTTVNQHTATYTISGVNGETGATVGSVDVSNTTHTNAGTYTTDSWSFTGTANYNNIAATTITDTINKADATVVVTPYNVTYNGNPHTATYTISGVNGETGATVGTVDVSNTTHTNAGTYTTDSWSFTGTANYNNIAATTITDTINKADATVVVTPYNVTYNGNPHTATYTISGVNGETGATVGTLM